MNKMLRGAHWIAGLVLLTAAIVNPAYAQTVEYIHTDALGTPVAVTDANRNVIERSEYEPYGTLLNRPLKDGPGYTGHVADAATGLSYMQQRYYDPGIGAFLSVDPVTADSSTGANFHRYRYANSNPYRFTDPDGREAANVSLASAGLCNHCFNTGEQPSLGAGLAVMAGSAAVVITGVFAPEALPVLAKLATPTLAKLATKVDAPKPADKTIYRMGTSKESPTRLGNKAAEAEKSKIGTHGVSGSTTKPSGQCSSASCSSLESAGFPVRATPTKNDPGHVTIELPKPVTKEVADKFNSTLGR